MVSEIHRSYLIPLMSIFSSIFTNRVICTSVSVNVLKLGVRGLTIRTIFVLRFVKGIFYCDCIHHCQSLPDKWSGIFDWNTLFHVINQLRGSKTLSDTLHIRYLKHLLKLTFTFLIQENVQNKIHEKSLDKAWLNRCSLNNLRRNLSNESNFINKA